MIEEVFGPAGLLSKKFPGYQAREGQVQLARAVSSAIDQGRNLLSEAGTGTGKSLGYLVPAAYASQDLIKAIDEDGHPYERRKTVLVVTGNILLQEQIINKDLPMLQSILPVEFRFALAKGIGNYLCASKFYKDKIDLEKQRRQMPMFQSDREPVTEEEQLEAMRSWAAGVLLPYARHAEEAQSKKRAAYMGSFGDMSELPFLPLPQVQRRFTVGPGECRSRDCKMFTSCVAQEAKRAFRGAQIIVTNYHLLLAHLLVAQTFGKDIILPPADIIICDEVHKLASTAADVLGFRISEGTIKRCGRKLPRDSRLREDLNVTARDFFDALGKVRNDRTFYKGRINSDVALSLMGPAQPLLRAMEAARLELTALASRTDDAEDKFDIVKDMDRNTTVCEQIRQALHDKPLSGSVESDEALVADIEQLPSLKPVKAAYFLDGNESGKDTVLAAKIVNPAPLLRVLLFGKETPEGEPVTVIATSATLCIGSRDFSYAASEMGVPQGYATLLADSPFHWPTQCLLIIPEENGLVEPSDPAWRAQVNDLFVKTVTLSRGRTLGLFTSHKGAKEAAQALRAQGAFTVYLQGDAPRSKLIEAFRENIASVLIGTESFWAGVDVPGEALSTVFIDKIPFPTPEDPVLSVIAETDEDWFFRYSIPKSIITFKQGFGRGVRSRDDTVVVVCCDGRLLWKSYGKTFLKSLPPCKTSLNLNDLPLFLEECHDDI